MVARTRKFSDARISPDIQVALGCVRTGSSLACNLIRDQRKEANYLGELHVEWSSERNMALPIMTRMHDLTGRAGIKLNPNLPFLDKVVTPGYGKDNPYNFLQANKIYFCVRSPQSHLSACSKHNWWEAQLPALIRQQSLLVSVATLFKGYRDMELIDYHDILKQYKGKKYDVPNLFGPDMTIKNGVVGFQDNHGKLKEGVVRENDETLQEFNGPDYVMFCRLHDVLKNILN